MPPALQELMIYFEFSMVYMLLIFLYVFFKLWENVVAPVTVFHDDREFFVKIAAVSLYHWQDFFSLKYNLYLTIITLTFNQLKYIIII